MSTHDVQVTGKIVVKTFRSWSRGEPDREWSSLQLLRRWTPGLAPEPIEPREESGYPIIVMSRMTGRALGDGPLSGEQVIAVAVSRLPPRVFVPAAAVNDLRERLADKPRVSPAAARAFDAGSSWLNSAEASHFATASGSGSGSGSAPQVFGHADGNLANYLWDGEVCRLVDFENAGASDEAYEIAELIEHPSTWLDEGLDAETLLGHLELSQSLLTRIRLARRVFACNWLTKLTPDQPTHGRNPLITLERQAERLLSLL